MPLLVRHPDTPPGAIHSVEVELHRVDGGAVATFKARGDVRQLVLPAPALPRRREELWKTTCFELFVADEDGGYREFNLSPSSEWAAYKFDDYRTGMRPAEAKIEIGISSSPKEFTITAKIESDFSQPARLGLTAVIEEADAVIRYWSTTFAPGEPDFHSPAVRSLLFDGVSAE
jgi:hypothetical protein